MNRIVKYAAIAVGAVIGSIAYSGSINFFLAALEGRPSERMVQISGEDERFQASLEFFEEQKREKELERITERGWGKQGRVSSCHLLSLDPKILYDDGLVERIIDYEDRNGGIGLFPADKGEPAMKGGPVSALNVCLRIPWESSWERDEVMAVAYGPNLP